MKLNSIFKYKLSVFKKIGFIFILLFLSLFAIADRYSHLELFAQTLNLIKVNYFKPVKIETLVYGAIKGLLKEIDPHSHFLLPEDFKQLKDETSGKFYGLGIEVERKENFLIVVSVFNNSPAHKAGFKQGDKILKINNTAIKNSTVDEFHNFLKRNKNKYSSFTVLRTDYKKPLIFRIKPVHLKVRSVDFQKIEKDFFYIRIYYFSERTLFEINKLLRNKKIEGLLLDLRGNPGGIFEQSVKIADLFLDKGLIVRYKIKTEKKDKEFLAHHSDTLEPFPLVVLIDEYSASASEILAGALKDHKRATLIGRKTFGKGSIQNVFQLTNNHALKLTVGEYQTPSGNFIHKIGIEPDIKLNKVKTNFPNTKNI